MPEHLVKTRRAVVAALYRLDVGRQGDDENTLPVLWSDASFCDRRHHDHAVDFLGLAATESDCAIHTVK